MQKGDIRKKMSKKLSGHIKVSLEKALTTAGDMALKRRARNVIGALELQDGNQVLEIGCGNGYYLSLLNRLGVKLQLTGMDKDILALKDAAIFIGDKKVKLVLGDASKLPFKTASFNRIVMSEVIEHVEDEEKVLKEAFRVLKTGGIMALTTCNIGYPFFWDPINWILQHLFKTHIKSGFWAGIWNQHDRLYKKEQVDKLIKKAGFKIEESRYLTAYCLPFNHYIVNLIAKLFYSRLLPESIHKSMNKFQNNSQPSLIKIGFYLINLWDHLNDILPQKSGVSIFIKVVKV